MAGFNPGNTLRLILTNHDGTGHKLAHNVTTIANIPLVLWLFYTVFTLRDAGYAEFATHMAHPLNIVAAVLFVIVTLRHFTLELEVVFEDYISKIALRNAVIIGMKIFWFVLGVTTIISILRLGF